ncbi:hypothetical protein CALCODRAFT_531300, partial [Calocera cornea HHB12733]
LSQKTIWRRRQEWEITRARQQRHDFESLRPYIEEIIASKKNAGVRRLKAYLRGDGVEASEHLIASYVRTFHPEEVERRKARRLKRKQFWSPGPFALLAVDQHDKWKRFGLFLHLGMDPFSGYITWCKVWCSNKNPILICSYFVEMMRRFQAIPLLTQSDPGTENYGISNAQCYLRWLLDPACVNRSQHRWMRGHSNIKPEIKWGQLRREFTASYEDLFQYGVTQGWYDVNVVIDKYVFRWLAVPFMQAELDDYVRIHNTTRPRADKNKLLPHGVPEHILEHPQRFGARDYRVLVTDSDIDLIEQLYATPSHPVFQLVPPTFDDHIAHNYRAIGAPAITLASFWMVYLRLRDASLCSPVRDTLMATLSSRTAEEVIINSEAIEPIFDVNEDVALPLPIFGVLGIGTPVEASSDDDELIPEVGDLLQPPLTDT